MVAKAIVDGRHLGGGRCGAGGRELDPAALVEGAVAHAPEPAIALVAQGVSPPLRRVKCEESRANHFE